MKYAIGILSGLFLFALSCKKAEDRRCWKGAGEEVTVEVEVETFNKLFLGPHIEYVLVQDTVEKVIITGGANLVNFIGTEVVEGELRVTNDNKCNFLRSYKKGVKAEVHLKDIFHLQFEGSKPLTCANQLNLPYFTILIRDGAGAMDMNVNTISLYTVVTHGWGNIKLSGTANYSRMEIRSNGFCDAYNLDVLDSIQVISKSAETLKVNVEGALMRSEIGSSGDIWYKGIPNTSYHNQYGTGKLVDKN